MSSFIGKKSYTGVSLGRYIGLVNHPFSQLEEVKNGRYGSRHLDIGGASSTQQMQAALQVGRETE